MNGQSLIKWSMNSHINAERYLKSSYVERIWIIRDMQTMYILYVARIHIIMQPKLSQRNCFVSKQFDPMLLCFVPYCYRIWPSNIKTPLVGDQCMYLPTLCRVHIFSWKECVFLRNCALIDKSFGSRRSLMTIKGWKSKYKSQLIANSISLSSCPVAHVFLLHRRRTRNIVIIQ